MLFYWEVTEGPFRYPVKVYLAINSGLSTAYADMTALYN
jgi:hypothetical protein